jgi:hypothetical protein
MMHTITKMKNYIVYILLLVSVNSVAQNRGFLVGNLHFGLFREGSFYDQPQKMIDAVNIMVDSIDRATSSAKDLAFLANYDALKMKKLLYSPYVQITIDGDSLVYLYLEQSDYDKIKIYKRQDLIDQNQKLVIHFKYKRVRNNRLICKKLIEFSLQEGETLGMTGKLKIEDYH